MTNTGADEGDATAVRSAASAALGAGSYSYKGSVADNDNYTGDSSDCEPFTVNKAQLTISTMIHDSNHAVMTRGIPLDLGYPSRHSAGGWQGHGFNDRCRDVHLLHGGELPRQRPPSGDTV